MCACWGSCTCTIFGVRRWYSPGLSCAAELRSLDSRGLLSLRKACARGLSRCWVGDSLVAEALQLRRRRGGELVELAVPS